jgi:hypothetical protein
MTFNHAIADVSYRSSGRQRRRGEASYTYPERATFGHPVKAA